MKRVNITEGLEDLYTASFEIKEVVGERGVFLCVDSQAEPSGTAFQQAVEQLHGIAYRIRSKLKKAGRLDFRLSRLEFHWVSDPRETPAAEWAWRLMLRVPDEVTQKDLGEARKVLLKHKGVAARGVKRVSWREGRALQVAHVGPYEKAGEAYAKLRARADELGYRVRGPGHEVYVGNPQGLPPHKLKRIIRLPIAWPRPDYARGRS